MDRLLPRPAGPRPLLAALALCLALSLSCIFAAPLLFHADASHYLSLGRSLSRGLGYHSGQLVFPDLMQPPLYPLLLAGLTGLLRSTLTAAVVLCVLCQVLTIALLWACHGLLFGPRYRVVSALLGAVSPNLAYGASLLLEPLFVLTQAAALYCLLRALRERQGWLFALLSGLCLGLGLLTRPEVVVTAAVFCGLCLLFPRSPSRRALLSGLIVAGGLACALPYGLWMRGELGFFEVLPKIRYNVPFADINAHMAWEPDEVRLGTREQRTFFTLLPDRSDFVMNYAFAHPDFEPRAQFPRRPETSDAAGRTRELKEVLWSVREVLKDMLLHTGALHPLALLLFLLGALAGLRGALGAAEGGGSDEGPPWTRREQQLLSLSLLALVGLNLGPAMVSGIDYFARYLAGSVLFSVPLVAAGALPAAAWLRRLGPFRALRRGAVLALLLVPVLGLYAAGTLHAARGSVSRAALRERMTLMERLCEEALPAGSRLVGEHPRYAFLRDSAFFQLPYSRSLEELLAYLQVHDVRYALLDSAALLRNPSRVNRTLADPRAWPAAWTPIASISPGGQPIWLLRLR